MNNTSKNKQLYLKVLIGVLVVGLIGTLFFLMNKSKSNNAADIVGSKDGENSNTIPANNYLGLDFLEYGVDEKGYASIFRGIVDCGSNYLGSDATYKDIQQFIESGCKITYDEPFRFNNNINAEDLSYKIDNSSSSNNENIVVLDNSKYKIGYQVYLKKDSSDGNYYFEKIIDPYNEFGEQTNIYNKVYLDDNIINLSLFSDLNPGFDVFTKMSLLFPENYQLDSDNNIVSFVVHSYNDGPNPYTATESINYKDGKIYEVTISGRSRKGSDAQETKFPVEGCIIRYTYSGTYRFIYDDLGLLRGIAYVMPEGNLDLLSYFVYYPIDPKPQDLACNIQYNQN